MDPSNLHNQQQVQHQPIILDSTPGTSTQVSKQPSSPSVVQGHVPQPGRPAVSQPATAVQRPVIGERILGMKTFFAKLHAGSLAFLEEQIAGWLKEHPNIRIKTTNVTVGDVQGKTTEPNLIVVIWY
ncbi:MAG: hypothetical protein QHH07_03665 [Sedimentisphaerales bacterium]|nr:hypothetical protein [Sedimentisphaerales bacterium]